MKRYVILISLILTTIGTESAFAQKYPSRPIRLVVASSPGGASGVIGTDIVAKAVPDGYTLLIIQPSLTINPSMIKKLPYDTVRDLAPISLVVDAAQVVTAHPSVPAKDVKELITLAIGESALPQFESSQWFGILAPARTPRPIIERLNQALAQASSSTDVKSRLAAEGVEVVNSTPEAFEAVIRKELVQLGQGHQGSRHRTTTMKELQERT